MAPATLILLIMFLISQAKSETNNNLPTFILPFAETQYQKVADQQIPILRQNEDPSGYPSEGLPTEDRWQSTNREAWTSGFLAGALWHLSSLADATATATWQNRAQTVQQGLLSMQHRNRSHDVGFIMFSSFGNAFLRTRNSSYLPPLHTAAVTLSGRYNQIVGCTRSWDNQNGAPSERFEVIIDNMMNLELLFWVANYSSNATLYNMAISHAMRTSCEHVRPDGSTWHVVAFNSTDGAVMEKYTVQGYANDSTWARGQAWAVYGFTMAYRYSQNVWFLQTAQKTADFFLGHVGSEEMVPYWDFDAPYRKGYQPRDTSAAAIAASGLLELGEYLGEKYRDAGVKILEGLVKYRADRLAVFKIPAILLNGTKFYNQNDFDSALIYGDYYFLEGLLRLSRYAIVPTPV
ncbi:hypothetical protein SUGI_0288550 [Cryptomeria japonica]|uniref:uncharacterized protein LOC131057064 n=1 Tax=Cryptomeria japonica TaxID=3369 RepID=UPI002408ADF0|nr:uncharacterized protein LOC131057064 [Cryptomeria japonica]GLJ16759.1 hypothetical protein SUGI_0288550 [Cryptomeria japonica]